MNEKQVYIIQQLAILGLALMVKPETMTQLIALLTIFMIAIFIPYFKEKEELTK